MRLVLLCAVALAIEACDPDDPCDPDQIYSYGLCYITSPDAGVPDALPGAPDAREVAPGTDCGSNADCSPSASFCAILPGASVGYCTPTGCKADPSVCPAGWGCFDIATIYPGQPSICTKP